MRFDAGMLQLGEYVPTPGKPGDAALTYIPNARIGREPTVSGVIAHVSLTLRFIDGLSDQLGQLLAGVLAVQVPPSEPIAAMKL